MSHVKFIKFTTIGRPEAHQGAAAPWTPAQGGDPPGPPSAASLRFAAVHRPKLDDAIGVRAPGREGLRRIFGGRELAVS